MMAMNCHSFAPAGEQHRQRSDKQYDYRTEVGLRQQQDREDQNHAHRF